MQRRDSSTTYMTEARLHLPPADEDSRSEVLSHVRRLVLDLPDFHDPSAASEPTGLDPNDVVTHGEAFVLIVPLIETCLADDVEQLDPPLVAQFAMLAAFPSLPESVALQIAFGRSVGEEQIREIARLFARAHQHGLTVDEYVADLVAEDAVPRGKLVRMFHGETRRAPDLARIAQGIALLRSIASLTPSLLQPPLLCMIAWLHWAQGKRPHAMAYVAEALRITPDHVLARGLEWLVTTKRPQWENSARAAARSVVAKV